MVSKLMDEIYAFWQGQAAAGKAGDLVTHRDAHQVNLEIAVISELLSAQDTVLDVGCGSGYSSAFLAKKCARLVGMDYSPKMIAQALQAHQVANLSFLVGDVLDPPAELADFSVIITTRCLINLTSWQDQQKALLNLHRRLAPGGRLVLAEGIKQGRDALNGLRVALGLEAMPPVWHNIDFDLDLLLPFMEGRFTLEKDLRFGLYDVLTRVNYPACLAPEEVRYNTQFQAVAEKLQMLLPIPEMDKFSREACLVFRKK